MAYEMMIALTISDDAAYADYRDAILPFLARYGAGFRYDFEVSRVFATESDRHINRTFVLSFPDRASKEAFWSDRDFLAIRATLFERSVRMFTLISEYEQ